jgi:hypothetical protein
VDDLFFLYQESCEDENGDQVFNTKPSSSKYLEFESMLHYLENRDI